MSTELITKTTSDVQSTVQSKIKSGLMIFHCFNVFSTTSVFDRECCEIKSLKMPCSGMTREIVLLKAFEAGADAVIVLACPEGSCRYVEGNIRAKKRVMRVKQLLDEIGLDGRRLNFYNVLQGDQEAIEKIIDNTISDLSILGPNPAA